MVEDKESILKNTLMGLPDELLKLIVGQVVKNETFVDSTEEETRRIIECLVDKDDLLKLFQGIQKPEDIADEEVNNKNVFCVTLRWVKVDMVRPAEYKGREFFVLDLDDNESRRYDIKHFDLQVNIVRDYAGMLFGHKTRVAKATIKILQKIPRLYRNLQTCSVTIWRCCLDSEYFEDQRLGGPVAEGHSENDEVYLYVKSVIDTMRSMRAPRLEARYVNLEQAVNEERFSVQVKNENREPFRVDGTDVAVPGLT